MSVAVDELVARMRAGDPGALARLISLVENQGPDLLPIIAAIKPHLGRAYRVGVTGPPGAGKSTLIDGLITEMRKQGLSVGVIAIDPTSPVSGGAVLGDRVRMQRHYLDSGVFIRSLAARGSLGGLSKAVGVTAALMDAAGKDFVIIETVGVGQGDFAIREMAETVVLVLVPETGDDIQVLKAGIMEVADIIVVNKADREGAERLVEGLKCNLAPGGMGPVVLAVQAVSGAGIAELYQEIESRRALRSE
jgi:LAO/AO transport system kinase